jgi:ribosomal protein S18 acetylase RimI-like enzyme
METIQSLKTISFDTIFTAFNEAFSDYEVQVSKEELEAMLTRRGFLPELSFGAFDNGKLVAFTLNGIGIFGGIKTAYDTGTGTLKDYRGKGIASKIFTHSIPYLKDAGVSQYLLEVLQHNTNAVSVYRKLGFEVSREFCYFKQPASEVVLDHKPLPNGYALQNITLEYKEQMMEFWDFAPSWQNSFEAVSRNIADFTAIGAFDQQTLVGYCIFEPNSGDITQIAVDKAHRRRGIASALLNEAAKHNRFSTIKAINTEITCEPITAFLASKNISLLGKQFEMIKTL